MENELKLRAELSKKINAISKDMGALKEDGENKFSKYKYISSEQMLTSNRTNFSAHNICIIPNVVDYSEKTFVSNDKNWVRTIVKMEFEIVDTETGYSIVSKWVGADQDTGGKSFGQAVTESCKRFYFKLFNVTAKDDIDPDSKTTEVQGKLVNMLQNKLGKQIKELKLNQETFTEITGLKSTKGLNDDEYVYAIGELERFAKGGEK